jgi:ABC-2 type transport system ATP-binding protein
MLEARNLGKAYGRVMAVNGVSLSLAAGQLLGLLGPNGAGKTTTVSMLAGLVRPDHGQVLVDGHRLAGDADPVKRRIGLVPQDVALYDELTARDNLRFFGGLYGFRGAVLERAIASALDRVGLADRARERVATYSGGMKRRLNLAAVLLHDPDILLLDEPTVGVDPQSRDRIYDTLAELARAGVALLLTTHHLEEAEARCARTVIIDHGKVIAAGTLPELVDQTVGRSRLVTLRLDRNLDPGSGFSIDEQNPRLVKADMRDVAAELPPLLARIRQAGGSVEDVDVRGPSLQAVFIHLTGRELRE